jgi:hypothetical protein
LLPLGAYAVHQARYYLAFGDRAGAELHDQGHAYLALLATPLALLTALGLGGYLNRLARAWRTGEHEHRHVGLVRTWLTAAALLAIVYVTQETLEGFLAHGHPEGWAVMFGAGGWIAFPVAFAVAGVITAIMGVGAGVVAWAARRARPTAHARRPAAVCIRGRRSHTPLRLAPLATLSAGRAPPLPAASST